MGAGVSGMKCSERGQDSQGQVGVKGPDGDGAWGMLRRLIRFLLPHTSDPLGWGCLRQVVGGSGPLGAVQLSREDNCDGTCGFLSHGQGGALSGARPLGQYVSSVHFRLKGHGGCGAER